MSLIGNILWIIFGGLIAALGYFLGGLVLCLTVVGIPFGVQAFKLGAAVFAPFGKKVVDKSSGGCLQVTFNIIWILLFGWEIAIAHVLSAIVLAITIVGIPFAKQHIKLVPLSLLPFGHEMVDAE